LNIGLKHVYPSIVRASFFSKFGIRGLVGLVPFLINHYIYLSPKLKKFNRDAEETRQKLIKFGKNGNL
jgi:hypothetical protein